MNSAHYDPKTRSMREDPLPDADPNEKLYAVSATSPEKVFTQSDVICMFINFDRFYV